MNIKNGRNRLELCPASGTGASARRLGKLAYGISPDEATPLAQVEALIQAGLTTDILDNTNAWTGANTFSSTATFSDTTGVRTDAITPRTSGGGTVVLRPAGIFTTTPITAASLKSNGVYGLSKADGITVALPAAATATIGTTIRFHIITTSTSGGYVISTGEAGDVMVGGLWATIANPDAANDMEFNIADGTENTLTLGATTACGLAGGYFEFTCISATQWAVSGTVLGSGIVASNLFTTV